MYTLKADTDSTKVIDSGIKPAEFPHGDSAVFICHKGFTLMELTIVLAILAIIAAILIPTFINAADRARLRSDIQSARVIHNAMELYRAERGRVVQGNNMAEILVNLRTEGFLEAGRDTPQFGNGAVWQVRTVGDSSDVVVHLPSPISSSVQRIINALTEDEKKLISPTPP